MSEELSAVTSPWASSGGTGEGPAVRLVGSLPGVGVPGSSGGGGPGRGALRSGLSSLGTGTGLWDSSCDLWFVKEVSAVKTISSSDFSQNPFVSPKMGGLTRCKAPGSSACWQ